MKASGSNQSRSNPDLLQRLKKTRQEIALRDHVPEESVADDLVTQSGSGLDTDISLAAAQQQVQRIAQARNIPATRVEALLRSQTDTAPLGLGQPHANVLKLNLALDHLTP